MIVPAFPEQIITEGIEMGPITLSVDGLGTFLNETITQDMLYGTLWFVL